jgi:hypothetical protein
LAVFSFGKSNSRRIRHVSCTGGGLAGAGAKLLQKRLGAQINPVLFIDHPVLTEIRFVASLSWFHPPMISEFVYLFVFSVDGDARKLRGRGENTIAPSGSSVKLSNITVVSIGEAD